jgi:hypothetical protein
MASCCKTYDPCLDNKINQIGSYASAARQSAQNSAASAAAADAEAAQAASSAAAAAASAAAAAISAEIAGIYLGAFAVPPTTDNQGGPLQDGMLYYNTVSNAMFVYNGSAWEPAFSDMPTGGGSDKVFYLNDNQVTVDYTIPAGKNAMSAGPITVIPGVTVTVPPGQSWTIV